MRVNFIWVLCVFTFFFTPLRAHGAEESLERVWIDKSHRGVTKYFSLRRDEDQWWLERFDVRPGELQRLVSRQAFSRAQDAIHDVQSEFPRAMESGAQPAVMNATSVSPSTEVPGRVIWKVENIWDWNWEIQYADWVRENIKADFFQKYQIGVDCADVAFSARWIFSRIHHLPAGDTLSATGALFTQDSMLKEWESLPQSENWNEDQLFRTALKYILDNTYTHTLMRDSYPISIVRGALLPGTLHLSLTQDSGHTYMVSTVDLSENSAEPIRVIYSTVPADARRLLESGFWEVQQPVEKKGGFVRFRWLEKSDDQWVLKPADQMSYYSTDQYAPAFMKGFGSFAEAVAVKLNPHLDFKARFQKAIDTVIDRIHARATIVEKGEKVCATEDCKEGTLNYENWSTPLKDQNLRETIHSLEEYADQMSDHVPGLSEIWEKNLKRPILQLDGVDYSLGAVAYAWKIGSFSSDPRQPMAVRWGLSGSAFRDFVQRQLHFWFNERQLKISAQSRACERLGACKVGSSDWQAWQTFDLDAKIQALALESASYCDYAPKSECDRFESNLDRNVIEFAPWLNSSPARSSIERWGSLKEKYLNHLADPGDILKISKNGWMFSRTEEHSSSSILENKVNEAKIHAPRGFAFTGIDLESGLAVAEKVSNGSKDILVVDPEDQSIRMRQRVSVTTESAWISSSRLVLSNEHSMQLFDCSHSLCSSSFVEPVTNRPMLTHLPLSEVLLIHSSSGTYEIVDARKPSVRRTIFSWNDSAQYLPESISLETRDFWGGMATFSSPGGDVDRRQFFVRKSDGKVLMPEFGNVEYLQSISWSGKRGVLAQLYESDEKLSFVELDKDFKIESRVVLGKEVESKKPVCRDTSGFYFLAEDEQGRSQYYRFSNEKLIRAPLLSDEIEAVAGCRDEMILKTVTGERLRKWGSSDPQFESARIEFLTPQPEEGAIRWIISSPMKDFQQSELYDLEAVAEGPVLTGSLTRAEDHEASHPSIARLGHFISVSQDRLLWISVTPPSELRLFLKDPHERLNTGDVRVFQLRDF